MGRLERGESGVTVDSLAAILAALDVSLNEFFKPFEDVVRPRTPRRVGADARTQRSKATPTTSPGASSAASP